MHRETKKNENKMYGTIKRNSHWEIISPITILNKHVFKVAFHAIYCARPRYKEAKQQQPKTIRYIHKI